MSNIGIVKQIDSLGRIVLPIELRRAINVGKKRDSVEITLDGDKIIVKKYQPVCTSAVEKTT